jgi:hypothetical protein
MCLSNRSPIASLGAPMAEMPSLKQMAMNIFYIIGVVVVIIVIAGFLGLR